MTKTVSKVPKRAYSSVAPELLIAPDTKQKIEDVTRKGIYIALNLGNNVFSTPKTDEYKYKGNGFDITYKKHEPLQLGELSIDYTGGEGRAVPAKFSVSIRGSKIERITECFADAGLPMEIDELYNSLNKPANKIQPVNELRQ